MEIVIGIFNGQQVQVVQSNLAHTVRMIFQVEVVPVEQLQLLQIKILCL